MNIDAPHQALKMWQHANNHNRQVSWKSLPGTWMLQWELMSDHREPRNEKEIMHRKCQNLQTQTERKISGHAKEYSFERSAKYQMYADHCPHLYSGINLLTQQKPMQSRSLTSMRVSSHYILFSRFPICRSVKILE